MIKGGELKKGVCLRGKAGILISIKKESVILEEWGLKKAQVNPVRIDSDPGRW